MLDPVLAEKRLDYFDKQLNQKRQVKLKTCADVYEHWRAYKRLYKKAPKDGVEFQIDYIDTGLAHSDETRAKAPIALALHGAPGSYHDFALLIHHLSQQNVRVIAPNFPEYTATVKTKVLFRHSADEKAAYLRDFLKAINVNKIDLLVSHSSAIFPTLLILLNANNEAIAKQRQHQQQQSQQQHRIGCQNNSINNLATRNKDVVCTATNISSADHCDDIGNNVAEIKRHNKDNGFVEMSPARRDDCADDHYACQGEETGGDGREIFEDAKDEIDDNNNSRVIRNDDIKNDVEQVSNQNDSKPRDKRGRNSGKVKEKCGGTKNGQDVIVKFDQPIEIKAVALFNPAGHRLPKSMKPTWFKCGSVHVYQHKLGRSLFRKLGPAFLTVVGVPVRVDNMDNVMLSATVMRNSKCQRVVKQLEQLSQMKIPTLLVFSENDKLIEKEIFYEMTQFMKLDPKNFDVFNDDGNIELSRMYRLSFGQVLRQVSVNSQSSK